MKSTFPFGWFLAILSALLLGAIKSFGSYFQHLGDNLIIAVVWGVLLTVVLLGIVFLLIKFKEVSIPFKFKTAATYELLLLVAFTFGLFVTVLVNNHFFVVMGKQDKIQAEVAAQVGQMNAMFTDYQEHVNNRLAAHESYLKQVERNRNSNQALFIAEKLNQYSIESLLIVLQSEIACDETMQEEIKAKTESTINKTSKLGLLFGLLKDIKGINANLESTRKEFKNLDRTSEKGLNGPHWDYTLTISDDILRHFKKAQVESINIWSVLITILLGLIILLPYFIADRDGRHRGIFYELTHDRNNNGKLGI